ncbi:ribosome maturation factor RimM [Prochlorococcus sp. MIT 1223]|uniref:ribosome maturation factor RimM n=1 Tax=Prochlorococcus sp. MIT 1223 TaxID=3096217 RepID=UPI002A752EB1|nr:ribosome maturation factor RimM [Prochlorococcus sp. MIT 1223]
MFSEQDWLTVGKVVSAQGLHGEIRINPSSDFPERFTQPGSRWIQKTSEEPQEIELLKGRQIPGKSIYIISLQGISNRLSAQGLIGSKLLVPSTDRPKLKPNEFHLLDLVGLEVKINLKEPSIGKVSNLINAGNDLLEVKTKEGKKILIPFVSEIVPSLNLEEGWLKINPPPGLLDIENLD